MVAGRLPVIVGVDGSRSSLTALRWGARQSELTGCPLRGVTAWHWPAAYGRAPSTIAADLRADTTEVLSAAADQLLAEFPDVVLEQLVAEGHPAEVLVEQSWDASLLVVGDRGRSAVVDMVLGSVATHCIRQAACPVAVLR